ncbi:hypothetical protein K1719_019964 [Acacia pycnantha]|nr:hypothetical protein K1719_019964 [Acacia pycnantha]
MRHSYLVMGLETIQNLRSVKYNIVKRRGNRVNMCIYDVYCYVTSLQSSDGGANQLHGIYNHDEFLPECATCDSLLS